MPAPLPLSELRQLLAARFPSASRKNVGSHLRTHIAAIDDALEGGLPSGILCECVAPTASCGGQLVIEAMLLAARHRRLRAALVDAGESFDPDGADPQTLPHLLWVRCPDLDAALQTADIVLRDGNIGLAIIDLRGVGIPLVRRVPSTLWYRLQRAAEPSASTVVFFTKTACIPSARCRFLLEGAFHIDALDRERTQLTTALSVSIQRHYLRTTHAESEDHVRRTFPARLSSPGPAPDDTGEHPAARIA